MTNKPFPKERYTKYELARVLGARALQLSFNAPILIKIEKETLEDMRYDPVKIAEMELDEGILPISIRRPLPKKLDRKKLKQDKEIEKIEKLEKTEQETEKSEKKEIKQIEKEIEKKSEEESETEEPVEKETKEKKPEKEEDEEQSEEEKILEEIQSEE